MAEAARWIDLLDPSEEELESQLPIAVHERALWLLGRPTVYRDEPRPKVESHGEYLFAILLVPVVVPKEDTIFFQEVDVVQMRDTLLTVRKSPAGRPPYDLARARGRARESVSAGALLYHLIDDVADRYMKVIDDEIAEVEELEDTIEEGDAAVAASRIRALRHDLLHVRRNLAPTRDAVRDLLDKRIGLDGEDMITGDIAISMRGAYEKLLRASEGLEVARELLASAREYQQAKITTEQTDIVKRLTVIASLLLFPTFWVGVYGQNFTHFPELDWRLGYAYSWGVIAAVTVLQLAFFRWRKWI